MTEKEILKIIAVCFGVAGFFLLYVIARRFRGLVLFLIWAVFMALFAVSAELHMLHETANSWDFAFAVMAQSIPLMLGGTIGVVYGIYKRDTT